jgi:hypothetical protein
VSYESLIDYLGDIRAPERLDTPPGGSAGCNVSDAYLSVIAEKARTSTDPLAYLRGVAIRLSDTAAPGNWQCAALTRVAAWADEWRGVSHIERSKAA